ncbi:retrovirus-related Pol polyprotein from transposon 412 [Trichonephila clavipes]|uniref:Retrovirus-related Pol polyprotein from transposon 412 n=1 Tax=Trichonephila clavipes TaxID=2585209 RepID=A0A8X6V9G1_TRICX|nr:retrovirus-related Pol polyprotein from transposon 412 [Trichonephila clavipes]
MRIILKDDIPVYQPARRLSFSENRDVNKQIDEWLEQGIVRPSSSEYASPIVLVKKKDGTTRLCVDYRRLNRKLVKDRFPLPLIEDVLDRLQEPKCTQHGQFEFNKVPFGLSTSPNVFQRYVYSIFRELMRKGIVIIYMDDLVIPAKDEKEGLEKLREVLEVASKYGLEMKFKKMSIPKKKSRIFGPRRRKWDNTSFNCKNNSRQEVSGTNNSQTSAELFRTHRLLSQIYSSVLSNSETIE